MILLDGKKLSQKILAELQQEIVGLSRKPRLGIVVVGENLATHTFIEQKKKAAEKIGADVRFYNFPETITTNELRKRLAEIVHEEKNTSVIVQLPLPAHINAQYILNAITPEKDVDVLSSRAVGNFVTGKSVILPPLVGVVKALFDEYAIDYKNKYIVVVGAGKLVGRPIAVWLMSESATVTMITKDTVHPEIYMQQADILISGIGKPKYITSDMIKEGAIVIDAGTSEIDGALFGDVEFDLVAQKASYITPVPGGVGPVTIAMLLKNLVILAQQKL